jgi:DNA-binding LacI/PurR family transcriptional regulator
MAAPKKTADISPPFARRVTLRDLAERAGVSHVTVSRALRNDPSISPARRAEVKKLAEEMGYRPDPTLSALSAYRFARQQHKIQSALAWVNRHPNPKYWRMSGELKAYWIGAEKAALRFGYHLEEIITEPDAPVKRLEKILEARGVRGILLPPHHVPLDWAGFDWNKFSAVRFGMSVRNPDVHAVTSDQMRAVVMAMEKIRQHGYDRIGIVVARDWDRNLGGNYIGGFYAAHELFDLGHLVPPLATDFSLYEEQPKKAQQALERWLHKYKPDAILTTAAQLPGQLRELGVRIPQDLAVAGTSSLDIPLDAGINQNSEMIGRIAVETLISQINLNERGQPVAPCRILVESLWQDGKSLPPKRRVKFSPRFSRCRPAT